MKNIGIILIETRRRRRKKKKKRAKPILMGFGGAQSSTHFSSYLKLLGLLKAGGMKRMCHFKNK